jgi:RHS repeat-associated protein
MVERILNPDSPDPDRVLLHYDGEGNLDCTTKPGGTRDDCSRSGGDVSPLLVADFSYDYRNWLTAWNRPGNPASATDDRHTTYEHDALDRPITETETVGNSTTRHELSYIGATRQLADEKETGARQKTRSYSYDPFGRLTAMSYRSDGGATHKLSYAYDPRGSVSMLLDEAGAPKAAYGYTGYGEPDPELTAERLPDTGGQPDPTEQVNPFRYSAKRSDALSGTIDMGARQFGPALGQFLQADRYDSALADVGLSSDPLTSNRYSLAGGNPISFVEIDGHYAGGIQSRNIQVVGGDVLDRETGTVVSGPNEGSGPGTQPGGDSGWEAPSSSGPGGSGTGTTQPATSRNASSPPYAFYPAGTTPPKAAPGTMPLPDTFRTIPCLTLAGDCTIEASGPNVEEYERGGLRDYLGGAVRGYFGVDVGGNEESEVFRLSELGGSATVIGPRGASNAARAAWRTFAGGKAPKVDPVRPVPNPWGRRGSPAHGARVAEAEERFASRGWNTVSGGSLPERMYGRRFPDLVMERNGRLIAFQIGRTTRSGRPIARERRALGDLQATGEFEHVWFLGYGP